MKKLLIIILLFFIQNKSFSQKVTNINSIISNLKYEFNLKGSPEIYPILINNDTVANIFNYTNGYFVLSSYINFYPLKAFSSNRKISSSSKDFNTFISMLKQDYILQSELIKSNKNILKQNLDAWTKLQHNLLNAKGSDTIGPLLESLYGQVNCKDENNNLINVTNYYTPNNYAVGCVAMTMLTTMQYFEWPIHGTSSHEYSDNYGASTGTYKADFENTTYNWSNIQNLYYHVPSTDETRKAIGRLAFDVAVALDMDFENGGSTSNINRIPNAVKTYFRYDRPIYKTKDEPEFWNLIDSSITHSSPVQLAVSTSSGAGHAIVCDGIINTDNPQNKYYHLNMGWWGSSNGWYLIQTDFNAGGYSVVDAAVMGLTPIPEISNVKFDIETNIATLKWYYSPRITNPEFELQMRVNNSDWQTVSESISETQYSFTPDLDATYYFRVKTAQNNDWSEEVKFSPANELSHLKEINLYPTMADSKIFVEYKNLKNAKFFLYNTNGLMVYHEKFGDYNGFKKEIDIPNLPRAIYIAKIITADKQKSFMMLIDGWKQ